MQLGYKCHINLDERRRGAIFFGVSIIESLIIELLIKY